MLEVTSLGMRFGPRWVLRDISFHAEAGSIIGLLGPNGAGKSTSMRLLTGFLKPSAGQIKVCGYDMVRQRLLAQRCLGYLPEAASGLGHLTVLEVLTFHAQARGLSKQALQTALARLHEHIELKPALHTQLRQLSKGWRQRAWLAQALIHDPPVLILDEPTDGLDPLQKREVIALLSYIRPGKTILFSTHTLEEAEALCDRILIIASGRLVTDQARQQLNDHYGRLSTAFYQLLDAA